MTNVYNTTKLSVGTSGSRKDLENRAYLRWSQETGDRTDAETELRALLTQHAQAVMYAVLRKNDPDLVTESVDRVMLGLDTFKGECLFTTWAHKGILSVMYDQRRTERRRKEVQLDIPGFDLPGDMTAGTIDVLLTVEKLLDEGEYAIFDQIVILGKTHGEAGEDLGIPKSTLSRKWNEITGKLSNAFAK